MAQKLRKGRRKPDLTRRALPFSAMRSGVVPKHPLAQDNLLRFRSWQMLLNDRVGDCVVVTYYNFRRLMRALAGQNDSWYQSLTDEQLVALYRVQNPHFDLHGTKDTNGPGSDADGGMDIHTLLEYLQKHGLPGEPNSKLVAFAKVDHTNPEEVEAAISIFGGVWTGINVDQENMDDFDSGRPWQYYPSGKDDGGHSIITGGYGSGQEKFITWATETAFTPEFWLHMVEEAWVCVWTENLGTAQFQEGIDLEAFGSAYASLTGRTLPPEVLNPPQPGPQPAPSPSPGPISPPTPAPVEPTNDPDALFASEAREWLSHRHEGAINLRLKGAMTAWLSNRGL